MQGCVDLLPCPPERTGATFCRVSGGDSDAWRPHPKAPAGPGPASETGGRPVPDNTTVTQLGIGSHQPWILVFLSHQTVPGLPADSGYRDAGRRTRDPPICSRLVAEGGRSGPWGRPRARWRSGSVGSGCPPGGSQWPFENGWRSGAPDLVSAIRPASAAFSPHTRCDQHTLKPSELRSHPTP